ncbi:MAG TPA: UPF0158 family protein [Chroococcales cyanobacterium]
MIDYDDDDEDYEEEEAEAEPGPLKLDLKELMFAYRDDGPDNAYYLDTTTGAIKLVNRSLFDLRELTDEVERHRYKYKYVPKPDRREVPDDLRAFMSTVEDEKLKNILSMAFESPHVLSSFKKIIESSPEERARLDNFLNRLTRERLETWLKANFIEYQWIENP